MCFLQDAGCVLLLERNGNYPSAFHCAILCPSDDLLADLYDIDRWQLLATLIVKGVRDGQSPYEELDASGIVWVRTIISCNHSHL